MNDSPSHRPPPPRVWEYELDGGWTVLAGKTDKDNEQLSLRVAGPNDWWFHVRGMPGSHVILQSRPDAEPDTATLKAAAAIAVYHSKARAGGKTPVACTRARFVSKPRGAPPGTVQIRKETLYHVHPKIP